MKTLLIFDWFGENALGLYLLDDAPEWLPRCHGGYINGDVSEEVEGLLIRVSDAICQEPSHYSDPKDELAGSWVSKKIGLDEVPIVDMGKIQIVVTGFVP